MAYPKLPNPIVVGPFNALHSLFLDIMVLFFKWGYLQFVCSGLKAFHPNFDLFASLFLTTSSFFLIHTFFFIKYLIAW